MARSRDRGMVTAELATVAPVCAALVLLAVWIVSLGVTQVRATDAARDAARLVARGETVRTATAAARRAGPEGLRVRVRIDDGVATVTARVSSRLPVPFFSGVGSRQVTARAAAVLESS